MVRFARHSKDRSTLSFLTLFFSKPPSKSDCRLDLYGEDILLVASIHDLYLEHKRTHLQL